MHCLTWNPSRIPMLEPFIPDLNIQAAICLPLNEVSFVSTSESAQPAIKPENNGECGD
jgi:hypothetical protein